MMKNKQRMTMVFFGILSLFLQNEGLAASSVPAKKSVELNVSPASQAMAGIVVTTIQSKPLTIFITAPGEVLPNDNLTTKITSRVAAQVVQRFVQEGEHVKQGQAIVTLSSVDMAKTQSELLLAAQEWERVKNLGKDAVSGKRYSEAEITYQRAYSTALAYGMTTSEITELLRTQQLGQAKGEFKLTAPRSGTVFDINFVEGELVEPGRMLLQIVDETTVWVDAKLPPNLVSPVKSGDIVKILLRNQMLEGKVIQVHHQLDETTRTRSVRIEVLNPDDLLHPGQFVNCQIAAGQMAPVLAVPVDAVIRTTDGDWTIYVEKARNVFQPVEVKVIKIIDNQAVIEGINPGTRIVVKGAFFIHSELNKNGFDAHD